MNIYFCRRKIQKIQIRIQIRNFSIKKTEQDYHQPLLLNPTLGQGDSTAGAPLQIGQTCRENLPVQLVVDQTINFQLDCRTTRLGRS